MTGHLGLNSSTSLPGPQERSAVAAHSSWKQFQEAGALSFQDPADVTLTLLDLGCWHLKESRSYRGLFFPLEIVGFFQAGRGGVHTPVHGFRPAEAKAQIARVWGGLW